jgi:hypothetical protein
MIDYLHAVLHVIHNIDRYNVAFEPIYLPYLIWSWSFASLLKLNKKEYTTRASNEPIRNTPAASTDKLVMMKSSFLCVFTNLLFNF